MWLRIQGWNVKKLSKAGKEILIKGVAQAIPSYCMAIFSLPTGLTDNMERLLNSFWWGNKAGNGRGINWLRWHKLCVDKKIGGLGFRSLQFLNAAMLGKMGWRLINDPDALVSRVLKAKYFPHDNFLTARLGHNPSYTWRSIHSAQDLVRRGVRWRIGDGNNVRIFRDPWLRRESNFAVSAYCPPGMEDARVSALILPNDRVWNIGFMEQVLNEEDINSIISIPLMPRSDPDRLIWNYSKHGGYTVKSAYRLASSLTLDHDYGEEGRWAEL